MTGGQFSYDYITSLVLSSPWNHSLRFPLRWRQMVTQVGSSKKLPRFHHKDHIQPWLVYWGERAHQPVVNIITNSQSGVFTSMRLLARNHDTILVWSTPVKSHNRHSLSHKTSLTCECDNRIMGTLKIWCGTSVAAKITWDDLSDVHDAGDAVWSSGDVAYLYPVYKIAVNQRLCLYTTGTSKLRLVKTLLYCPPEVFSTCRLWHNSLESHQLSPRTSISLLSITTIFIIFCKNITYITSYHKEHHYHHHLSQRTSLSSPITKNITIITIYH